MPRSLAKKQIACPANTLLEATGAHTYSFKLSQTHSFSQSITHAPLSSPCLMTTCAENKPYTHTDTQRCTLKPGWKQCYEMYHSNMQLSSYLSLHLHFPQVLICMLDFILLLWCLKMSVVHHYMTLNLDETVLYSFLSSFLHRCLCKLSSSFSICKRKSKTHQHPNTWTHFSFFNCCKSITLVKKYSIKYFNLLHIVFVDVWAIYGGWHWATPSESHAWHINCHSLHHLITQARSGTHALPEQLPEVSEAQFLLNSGSCIQGAVTFASCWAGERWVTLQAVYKPHTA